MKKIFLYTAAATAILFQSCLNDLLDKGPVSNLPDELVWSNPDYVDMYLANCYNTMKFSWDGNASANPQSTDANAQPYMMLCVSDEAYGCGPMIPAAASTMTADVTRFAYWQYTLLRNLHLLMDRLYSPECTLDPAFVEARFSEVRFLRAFLYFNMVKRYGGVPLVTKAVPDYKTATEEELYPVRAKEKEVYDFILDELDDLILEGLLPDVQADRGRPTKWAALALKSRVALYAGCLAKYETRFNGGTPYEGGVVGIHSSYAEHYFTESYNASKRIIDEGPFDLYRKQIDGTHQGYVNNYRQLFLDEKGNPEVIFSEIYDGISGKGHSYDMWLVPRKANVWGNGCVVTPFKEMVESYEMADGTRPALYVTSNSQDVFGAADNPKSVRELFEGREPRFFATIYKQEDTWKVNGVETMIDWRAGVIKDGQFIYGSETAIPGVTGELAQGLSFVSVTNPPFGVLKYLNEYGRSPAQQMYSDTDYIIFRLGEIYLNLAEAAVEIGNEEMKAQALIAVNAIRERAGAPAYLPLRTVATLTRDNVRLERKIELAFEGSRYWDLVRWRLAKSYISTQKHGYRYVLDWNTRYDEERRYYTFPTANASGGATQLSFADQHYYLPIAKSNLTANPKLVNNPGYAE